MAIYCVNNLEGDIKKMVLTIKNLLLLIRTRKKNQVAKCKVHICF